MAERRRQVTKRPNEILDNVFTGHSEAVLNGSETAKRYLLNYLEKNNSIPNAVKFFIYDLLAEDAYQAKDIGLCRQAVEQAEEYLPHARAESNRQLDEYLPKIRFVERGISIMVDAGEYQAAIAFCDKAIEIGLGKAYAAKKATIERML
ncbi:MAG: hypothetical protein GY858_09440 [Candidatus Omnitrophica bacterium]|nr:hypothetical protein [Candidatus Omnitrophota bacterium]